ncbi:MAG TPA: BlaI/MecI/CopY family transcriptional regulator [Longimicrobiales bacterium]|jgi:predicted transcriptional regulator|nr:BlaI/MecI/CopY family transcriptional regulator [Longimicrobiales bacterium]
MANHSTLSRRERQIMDVLYRRRAASAADVREGLPDPPGYSAVRAMLAKLERKGHLAHVEEGGRYIYRPIVPRDEASRSALKRMVSTFFDDSPARTVAAILDMESLDMNEDELDRLACMIDEARRRGG